MRRNFITTVILLCILTVFITNASKCMLRYKRNSKSCQRKLKQLDTTVNRRFRHLARINAFEKEERIESVAKLQSEIDELQKEIEKYTDGAKLYANQNRLKEENDWGRYLDNLKVGLHAEKRKFAQMAGQLKWIKNIIVVCDGGVNETRIEDGMARLDIYKFVNNDSMNEVSGDSASRLTEIETMVTNYEIQLVKYKQLVEDNSNTITKLTLYYNHTMHELNARNIQMKKRIMELEHQQRVNIKPRSSLCDKNNGGCDHLCNETSTQSVQCSCSVGFVLGYNKASCSDINECAKHNGGCRHVCVNNPGSFICLCNKKFVLQDDGKACLRDIRGMKLSSIFKRFKWRTI